ncbi:MAG: hypothetical protein EU550_01580 [Promethearchaeota archaeon]|nr:MAG: hypothetical protein EU550_01580 [Candidatus Lokiarchaeota archaeon]
MNEEDEKEKISSIFRKAAEGKEKKVAKEKVSLTHVETKKQEASQETIDLARRLKEQYITHDSFEKLSNDEITIIESIQDKRMFLSRIAIIANQSRIPMGKEPYKKGELEDILSNLIAKGYVTSEIVGKNRVYYLTERGKYRVQ